MFYYWQEQGFLSFSSLFLANVFPNFLRHTEKDLTCNVSGLNNWLLRAVFIVSLSLPPSSLLSRIFKFRATAVCYSITQIACLPKVPLQWPESRQETGNFNRKTYLQGIANKRRKECIKTGISMSLVPGYALAYLSTYCLGPFSYLRETISSRLALKCNRGLLLWSRPHCLDVSCHCDSAHLTQNLTPSVVIGPGRAGVSMLFLHKPLYGAHSSSKGYGYSCISCHKPRQRCFIWSWKATNSDQVLTAKMLSKICHVRAFNC